MDISPVFLSPFALPLSFVLVPLTFIFEERYIIEGAQKTLPHNTNRKRYYQTRKKGILLLRKK